MSYIVPSSVRRVFTRALAFTPHVLPVSSYTLSIVSYFYVDLVLVLEIKTRDRDGPSFSDEGELVREAVMLLAQQRCEIRPH